MMILNRPDQASPITIEFDLTSFKCFVSIIKPFALDLRGSNFGTLIGFEPTVIRQIQYNVNTGLYEYCESIFDIFKKVGSEVAKKAASEGAKKALEKAGTQALEAGMKRLGDEAGKYAGEKQF